MDLGALAQTLAQTLAGAAAALAGGWLVGRQQERARQAAARERRRERAAETLGPLQALLSAADPDRLAFSADPVRSERAFEALDEQWQRLQGPLLVMRAGDPSDRVRDLARRLDAATEKSLASARFYVNDLLQPAVDARPAREEARRDQAEARQVLEELLEALYDRRPPRRRAAGKGAGRSGARP